MKEIESLPIWPRILAAKPRGCRARTPAAVIAAVKSAGGLTQAGPVLRDAGGRTLSGLELADIYGTGVAGLPPRARARSHQHLGGRLQSWGVFSGAPGRFCMAQATRDARRAEKDKKFAAAKARREAAEARLRVVVLHIGDRAALRAGIRGHLEYGGARRFSFRGNFRHASYRPTHARPGVAVRDGEIYLEPTGGRRPIHVGPMPPPSVVRAAALGEPHPVGLLAMPVKGQAGVFACLGVREQKWVPVGYCVRGRLVPECVALGTITLADIEAEQNVETRQILVERYGYARYMAEVGAVEIDHSDMGTLYSLHGAKVVKVVNSTPEPDGSYKDYHLRVPPEMTSAHQAVAWTFGLTPDAYAPAVQS